MEFIRCLLTLFFLVPWSGADVEAEFRFLNSLRSRGLFRLAEMQCRKSMSRDDLEPRVAIELAVELAKILGGKGLAVAATEREEVWRVLNEQLKSDVERWRREPEVILLQCQQSLALLLQAEATRAEAEIRSERNDDEVVERSRLQNLRAVHSLQQVTDQIHKLRLARKPIGSLSPERLDELGDGMQFQRGMAYWNQALAFQSRDADRTHALTQALAQFQPLAERKEEGPIVWRSRLAEIRCYRLLPDIRQAHQRLDAISLPPVPEEIQAELVAERVRTSLARGDLPTALQAAESSEVSVLQGRFPDLELARIELLVAQLAAQPSAQSSPQLQGTAAQLAADLAERHGHYWGLRGEMLIARQVRQDPGSGSSELLDRATQTFLQRDRPEEAIAMLIEQAQEAERQQDDGRAFKYRYQAGLVDHQREQWQAAIDRLRDAAIKYPKESEASKAHLLATFDAAALYQQQIQNQSSTQESQRSLEQYRRLLHDHLVHWPSDPTANQARMWLARIREAEHDFTSAWDVYCEVTADSEHSRERYERMTRLVLTEMANAITNKSEIAAWRQWFREQAELHNNPQQTTAALSGARLHLMLSPTEPMDAERLLTSVMNRKQADPAQLQQVRSLMVVAAAGRDQLDVARQTLAQASPLPLPRLIEILQGLQLILDERPRSPKTLILMAEVLPLVELYRSDLEAEGTHLVELSKADLIPESEWTTARDRFAELAARFPKEGRIQRRFGNVLSRGEDQAARKLGLDQWRLVLRHQPPQSYGWFEAKLRIASLHYQLGDRKQAYEMVEVLRNLYPDLGGPELKRDFLKIWERSSPQ